MRELSAGNPSLQVLLDALTLESLEGGQAVISVSEADKLGYAKTRCAMIEGLLTQAAGCALRVAFRAGEPSGRWPGSAPASVDPAARAAAMDHPLVKRAAELFGARLVDVQDDPPGP